MRRLHCPAISTITRIEIRFACCITPFRHPRPAQRPIDLTPSQQNADLRAIHKTYGQIHLVELFDFLNFLLVHQPCHNRGQRLRTEHIFRLQDRDTSVGVLDDPILRLRSICHKPTAVTPARVNRRQSPTGRDADTLHRPIKPQNAARWRLCAPFRAHNRHLAATFTITPERSPELRRAPGAPGGPGRPPGRWRPGRPGRPGTGAGHRPPARRRAGPG